jgi:hypothetical protein
MGTKRTLCAGEDPHLQDQARRSSSQFQKQLMPAAHPVTRPAFAETLRRDAWWMQPLVVFLGFTAFIVYSTWAAFQNAHYWFEGGGADYLSPFASPEIFGSSPHSIFGPKPGWWPAWLPFSASFFVLWIPAGFRFTCYYYRGAYYKAFSADPLACAVGEGRKTYLGERFFPFILQNFHRYFFYLAFVVLFLLGYDAWKAMWFRAPQGAVHFGIGVGTLVLTVNVILLSGYTLGCHSLRHLIGGWRDRISRSKCGGCYRAVSCLNRKHMAWAWVSLVWVGFTDVYVRLCSMGIWHDYRIF